MVSTQLRQTLDEGVRVALQRIVRQIMSLAEVYEHLLGFGMSGRIDLGGYVSALCANLPDLQRIHQFPVVLACDADPLLVTLASATALGIVLTELISNSYEHAFPNRGGTIDVRVRQGDSGDKGLITVVDDGIGFVPEAESRRRGVGLVRRLMQQVEGTLDVVAGTGKTVWTLHFPIIPATDTPATTV